MSNATPLPLPSYDRYLLRSVERIVPSADRDEWSRAWQAELWHMHHRSRKHRVQALVVIADLSIGLARDALWLRTESWRRSLSGTATLCLVSLIGLSLLSTLIASALEGSWHAFSPYLRTQFHHDLIASPLVVFVAFATASRRHSEPGSTSRRLFWIKRQLFFAVKIAQVLLLACLLSADLFQPLRTPLPNTADFCQIPCFVIIALLGLRWAFRDQEQRCKHCLHSLASPARVGRPSHNLLEWNGTELTCKHGHGLLSVPEMETSWCQSSQWVDLTPRWDRAAGI